MQYTFNFPELDTWKRPKTFNEQVEKITSEVIEVELADASCERIIELFEVIHAAETALHKVVDDMSLISKEQRQIVLDCCYAQAIAKNLARGYYDSKEISKWLDERTYHGELLGRAGYVSGNAGKCEGDERGGEPDVLAEKHKARLSCG